MQRRSYLLVIAIVCGLAMGGAGCAGGGYVYNGNGWGYDYGFTPSLAYIGSGVWVVENQPYPIFFSNGYYWRYGDGIWYRSDRYWRGWRHVRGPRVPYYVRRIHRPYRYRYYYGRPGVYVRRGYDGRVYRRDYPEYRRYRDGRYYRRYYRYPGRRYHRGPDGRYYRGRDGRHYRGRDGRYYRGRDGRYYRGRDGRYYRGRDYPGYHRRHR